MKMCRAKETEPRLLMTAWLKSVEFVLMSVTSILHYLVVAGDLATKRLM